MEKRQQNALKLKNYVIMDRKLHDENGFSSQKMGVKPKVQRKQINNMSAPCLLGKGFWLGTIWAPRGGNVPG